MSIEDEGHVANCACELPGDGPHACAVASAMAWGEDVDAVIDNAGICKCRCHWRPGDEW